MRDHTPQEYRVTAQGLPLQCRLWEHADALRFCATAGGGVMEYGVAASPIGPLLAEWLPQGLCRLSFAAQGGVLDDRPWPGMVWKENAAHAQRLMERIFTASGHAANDPPLELLLRGTAFQLRVWRALLEIPRGRTLSYSELANAAATPGASRAVGTAMARNPIVYLVPCHRVIRSGGHTGHYGGGAALKVRMLDEERQPFAPGSV